MFVIVFIFLLIPSRSYYMERLPGSGMLRATMSNLVQERHEELTELGSHLSQLVIEKNMVVRNKKANEGEKKRVVAEIQKLRTKVANINSQISQVGWNLFYSKE